MAEVGWQYLFSSMQFLMVVHIAPSPFLKEGMLDKLFFFFHFIFHITSNVAILLDGTFFISFMFLMSC